MEITIKREAKIPAATTPNMPEAAHAQVQSA
jgi:hypothetical protein